MVKKEGRKKLISIKKKMELRKDDIIKIVGKRIGWNVEIRKMKKIGE